MKHPFKTFLLESHQPLWRIHNSRYKPTDFNDSCVGNARFSPLMARKTYQDEAVVYPTLYATNQYHEAFAETVMRNHGQDNKMLNEQILAQYQLSVVSPNTPALLADLDAPWVPPIIKTALAQGESAGVYPLLREFAVRLLAVKPQIQGLKWQSVQRHTQGQSVYVLINHPPVTQPITLSASQYSVSLLDPSVRDKVRECANLFNYTLCESML